MLVFVLVDGLRPDAITPAHAPTLLALMRRGAYSLSAQSVMPTLTLPCHVSLFHSLSAAQHGVLDNDWQPLPRPVPGLVDQAHAVGKRCAFFYNWEPLRNLNQPGSLHHSLFMQNCKDLEHGDQTIAAEAARYIPAQRPDFTFVYLGSLDERGHADGWMSAGYLEQVGRADKALAIVLESLPADTTLLVQSDHGGHDHLHGTDSPEDMTIPWILSGTGIRQNHALTGQVSLLDTAPTIAHILGFSPHPAWEGRCNTEIFI